MASVSETASNWLDPDAYSFDNIVLLIDGMPAKMPSSNDNPYRIKFNADQFTAKVGADGTSHLSRGMDRTGIIEAEVMANSPLNFILEAKLAGGGDDVFIIIKDMKRLDIVQGSGKVIKVADNQFGKTENERVWSFLIRELHMLTGTGKGIV